jgi:hypothetical protein
MLSSIKNTLMHFALVIVAIINDLLKVYANIL